MSTPSEEPKTECKFVPLCGEDWWRWLKALPRGIVLAHHTDLACIMRNPEWAVYDERKSATDCVIGAGETPEEALEQAINFLDEEQEKKS